jgi:D-threonate/D-erythronate kinase
MSLLLGMIADDLTGALDATAPFSQRGLKTRVVLSAERWGPALADGAQVVCVNTASREISSAEAARRVKQATIELMALRPRVLFKKVDSRLKGHLSVELSAMLGASNRRSIVLAPAIPDLGRVVTSGHVRGMGVADPIHVARLCPGLPVSVPDTDDVAALDRVAGEIMHDADGVLAAGARGLALALAMRFPAHGVPELPKPAMPLLVAIGSRDPITRAQVEHFIGEHAPLWLKAPNGEVPQGQYAPVTLVTAEAGASTESGPVVAARFAETLVPLLQQMEPRSMLICGGETAYALLSRLDVEAVDVLGEALPGVPQAKALIGGKQVDILTKSGGFGSAETISLLAGAPAEMI